MKYLDIGLGYLGKAGNPTGFDPADPCGATVAVIKGAKPTERLEAINQKCPAAEKMTIEQVPTTEQAVASVAAGRADVVYDSSPGLVWTAAQSGGALATVGEPEALNATGIGLPKQRADLAPLLVEALSALEADGTYQQILDKWSLGNTAVDEFTINTK